MIILYPIYVAGLLYLLSLSCSFNTASPSPPHTQQWWWVIHQPTERRAALSSRHGPSRPRPRRHQQGHVFCLAQTTDHKERTTYTVDFLSLIYFHSEHRTILYFPHQLPFDIIMQSLFFYIYPLSNIQVSIDSSQACVCVCLCVLIFNLLFLAIQLIIILYHNIITVCTRQPFPHGIEPNVHTKYHSAAPSTINKLYSFVAFTTRPVICMIFLLIVVNYYYYYASSDFSITNEAYIIIVCDH